MVHFTRACFAKSRFRREKASFVDKIRIHVKGGNGGSGEPRYGGIGGRGGHVYAEAEENTTLSLLISKHPKKRFFATHGQHSRKRMLLGQPGTDITIKVPPGVVVRNDEFKVLGDLDKDGEKCLIAKGGDGGAPENGYIGQKGHDMNLTLDLKVIADIGLVGFPNAGKSTFMKGMSRATPRIANFPFTTIRPQLGTMVFDDLRQITLADLPGLIEGAHMNVGLGHRFLKHVERTGLLLFMVDVHGFQLKTDSPARSAFETIMLLNKELELYKPELLDKPAVLALNKLDLPMADEYTKNVMDSLQTAEESVLGMEESLRPERLVRFRDVLRISAKTGMNMERARQRLRQILDEEAEAGLGEQEDAAQRYVLKQRSEHLAGDTLL